MPIGCVRLNGSAPQFSKNNLPIDLAVTCFLDDGNEAELLIRDVAVCRRWEF